MDTILARSCRSPRSTAARGAVAAVVVLAAAFGVRRRRFDRETRRRVERLRAAASASSRPYRESDVADLPAPVRRYFETVLTDGQRRARTVRLCQRGEFRMGGRTGTWKPMTAVQHYSTTPPAFVWDASIELAPGVPVRVVDAYEGGRGSLRAMVLSALEVASSDPSPEMDEGELLRYLAEAVWFPTALLPEAGVSWEAVDERSARATLEHGGTEATLTFHFDADGLVSRVSAAERYRQEDDSYERWTGSFDDYEWRGGALIPTTAAVEWNLSDGDVPYWRATITSVDVSTDDSA